MKKGLCIYRAEDEFGFHVREAYTKKDLIDKLIDEFGEERENEFKIIRVFERWLQ